jgi:hypothetical protein
VPHPRGVRRNRPERCAQLACTRKQRAPTGPVLRCSPAARQCHAAQPNFRA